MEGDSFLWNKLVRTSPLFNTCFLFMWQKHPLYQNDVHLIENISGVLF